MALARMTLSNTFRSGALLFLTTFSVKEVADEKKKGSSEGTVAD